MEEKNEKREIELRRRTPEERLQTAELRIVVLMQTVEKLQEKTARLETKVQEHNDDIRQIIEPPGLHDVPTST